MRGGATLATLMFWRYALAGALLVPLALGAGGAPGRAGLAPGGARPALATLVVAGAGQGAVAFLSLSALRWIPVGTLGFLFYSFPAWVTLFAAVRGSERPEARRLAALALSFVGIACTVGLPGGAAATAAGSPWPGVLLALAAAVVYALYIPYLGRLQARLTPALASAYVCLGTAAYFLVGSGFGVQLALGREAWQAIALLVLPCTVLAFLAFMRGLDRLGPVRTAIVSTVEPLFTATLGAVVLAQPLTPAMLGGGVLIAAAVLLLQLPPRRAAIAPTAARRRG